ncbi:spermidine synthase [Paenibacillus crassostreae]|uniref:Spermidine synthase n=1 Tax=Paenibacillus crassostreae TaxID=1763538 RepID=A0A167EVH5_9BACL|nr:fused MFS/spermidine synthase [Paenibacillus crassostreae]AOZ93427.1 spermidine synthase [Paenibacillus crassostreae]OAB75918.1 spermidine synthase [Paenibacillus crassostreae]
MHQLAKVDSRHQELTVYEANHLYGKIGKYRFLQFSDHAVQGAIDLRDPKRIVLEYPRAIIHIMERNNPSFDQVFVIGHGIGTIAGHYPDKQFTVAEIDELVVELSREYFDYQRDNIVVGDGREILKSQERHRFDYIILDAFTKDGTPDHLTTLEFFEMTLEKLNSMGSIIMNLMGRTKNDKLINAIYTTLSETYSYTKAFSLPSSDFSEVKNIIVIGSHEQIHVEPYSMAGFIEIQLGQGHIIKDRIQYKT